jgi:hypothetical protein
VVRKIQKRPARLFGVLALAAGLTAGLASPAVAEPAAPASVQAADAAAMATAKRTGQRVEVTERRTATGKVFAGPSGLMTLVQQVRWTQVNQAAPNRSYWDSGRDDGARVGLSVQPPGVFRSFFQLDTAQLAGTRVHRAGFRITLDHSTSCQPSPVDLWQTKAIDPAVPLTWNNSKNHWLGGAPLASGEGQACGEFDLGIGFATPALQDLVQRTADNRASVLTLGLRAPNDHDPRQEKLFHPDTAFLEVDYNTLPDAPRVNFASPKPCGTATAPTVVTGGSKQFSGVATDPDADNLTTTLEIVKSDGSLAYSSTVGSTGSGSAFSWPQIPVGVLVDGETYHYRARTSDGKDVGPDSADCYFTTDSVRPGAPRLESTDYPDGEPAILERTTGTVTIRPAVGDTDVAEYRYSFNQDKMTARITAGPDGTAVLPLTLFPDPFTHESSERLYVDAVDKAGNLSPKAPIRDMQALHNPAPQAHAPGDLTGDGRADVTALLDFGNDRTVTWNVVANDGGFHAATRVFDTGGSPSAPDDRFRQVRGDFDGDGRTDIAMLDQLSGERLALDLLVTDGTSYGARQVWSSGDEVLPISAARVLSGDFTADGKADIALQLGVAGGGWRVLVFPGGALSTPVPWYQSDVGYAQARLVSGDFDGDGTTDLAELRDEGGCRVSVRTYRSTGTAFADGVLRWDSGPGAYCADRSTPVTGDVDGDGRDDIVALYGTGSDTSMQVFTSAAGFVPQPWWHRTGEFDAAKAVISTGDFDIDGKADLAVVDSDAGRTRLWTLHSTGAIFGDRVLGWQEMTGAVPVQSGK